jgi:DNA invertase Pin-like site-specific DNA recombinase
MPASAPYGQTLDAQLEQLRGAGCTKIYRGKLTARQRRPELLKMLDHLAAGDVVTVTRIDRLARSAFDLFAISAGGLPPRGPSGNTSDDQRRTTGT